MACPSLRPFVIAVALCVGPSSASAEAEGAAVVDSALASDCTFQGRKMWGKVKVVEHFPDIKVKVVKHFEDLRVKQVDHFPDSCGRWQFVEHFPDFTIKYVEHFPDLEVRMVEHFEGLP